MHAAQISKYGGPEVLVAVSDAPKPTIEAGQVLVQVNAAGVNPFDIKVREGLARSVAELKFPAILGGDLAGVVAEVGAGVTQVKPGDEVYGQARALSGHGSFAEFAPVPASSIGPKPTNLSFKEAAALPLVGVSAIQAIVETMNLQPNQKILIHGGAGGIGSVAIQIAKHLGAHVAATASGTQLSYVKSLGADEVIDYQKREFQYTLTGYNAVLDTVGGETFSESFKVLAPGGMIVTLAAQPNPALDERYGVKSTSQHTQVTTERLAKLTKLVEAGVIKVHISTTFSLDNAGEALEYLHSGHHAGKVVIAVGA